MIIAGIDTETTGFLAPDHRLVEVYIGLWNEKGVLLKEMNQRIDPQRSIPMDAQRVHGISLSDLAGKPLWSAVAPTVQKWLAVAQLWVIHNAEFDTGFLKQELERESLSLPRRPVVDTMAARWATDVGKHPKLQELCFACGVAYDPALAHAAEYDVHRMMECFFKGRDWGFYEMPDISTRSDAA